MKHTRDAIRYGIETLGVTPEELFSLIESSEGYTGDDYKRWLAARIIEIAEKDDVGFTQLLVKKFSITQSLAEEYSDDSIKEEWLSYINNVLSKDNVYSVDIDDIGSPLEDVDWFNGIDIDDVNGDFVSERLPEEVRDVFLNDDNFTLFCKLSSESSDKSSELFKNAKMAGVQCKNEGSLMLYRVCSMISAFEECTKNFKFAFLASTNFLFDRDNEQIIKYFLNYFNYSGLVISSTEMLKDSFSKVDYALVICKPRSFSDGIQDGFVLNRAVLENGELSLLNAKRYSTSCNSMFDYIQSTKPKMCKNVLGYMLRDSQGRLYISSVEDSNMLSIPIVEDNLRDISVYYAVTKSLEGFGLSRNISEVISGHNLYTELFYNCFVLMLSDMDNVCKDYGVTRVNGVDHRIKNNLSLENEIVAKLLELGEVHFSFEAKQMLDIFKVFCEKYSSQLKSGKTYSDIMIETGDAEFNKQYIASTTALRDYISNLYRKM